MSIEYVESLSTQEIGNIHILLYKKDDEFILKQVQTALSTITSHVKVDVIDTITGDIVPQASPPEPKWAPAVRFYRIAQNANDLYEAYRSAYLSFEYLLDEIYSNKIYKNIKRKLNEKYREKQWLIDAFKNADSKY